MDKSGLGYVTLRVMFSAMHELGNPKLTAAENKKIFGKCYKTHGHNYYLEATVRGPIDDKTGLCCDREQVQQTLEALVVSQFNGKHLNKIFENTSGEELAREFFQILEPKIPGLVMVRLQETPKNYFTYGASLELSDFQFLMY